MRPQNKRPRRKFNPNFKKKFNHKKDRAPTFDQLMRKFKKDTEKSGIIKECKKREFYEKPSAKRRRLKNEATRRIQKQRFKEEMAFNRRGRGHY